MKCTRLASVLLLFSIASSSAQAADDTFFLELLTCQKSWMDWQNIPPKWTYFQSRIDADLRRFESTGQYFPTKPLTLLGVKAVEVYPHMATNDMGFSVIFDGTFDKVKALLAKHVGKPADNCSMASGKRACGYSIAPHRDLLLMETGTGKKERTLVSCAYGVQIRN